MLQSLRSLLGISPKPDLGVLVENGALILDVRTKVEYSDGHISGSINIPLNELPNKLNRLKDKQRPIITCCASGMRSASAKGILKSKGYATVHNGGGWVSLERKIN